MNRVRIFACAGAGLALAALGWFLPASDGVSAAMISRSAGLALFGVAMVAAGLVFRSAMLSVKLPAALKEHPSRSEFRSGFAKKRKAGAKRIADQNEVVVALRRAVAAQTPEPLPAPAALSLPPDQVERLQEMLHSRAAALRARNAEQAKRRFLRSGVDIHGLVRS